MLALRWHGRGDVRVEQVDRPGPPGHNEVQLEVLWCGVCGTDVEEYRDGPIFVPADRVPLVLGHEISGRVVAAGDGTGELRVGDIVGVDGLIGCGDCSPCRRGLINLCVDLVAIGLMRDGGLAEYVNVPAEVCVRIPDDVAVEAGALAETLAVGVRALRQGRLSEGESVVVMGGGAVGLLAAQAARAMGAGRVALIEPRADRRELGLRLGVDLALGPDEADGISGDVIVECSGVMAAVSASIDRAAKGGRVVLVGIAPGTVAIDPLRFVLNELELIGSLSHLKDVDFARAIELVQSGRVQLEPLITHRAALADAAEVIGELRRRPQDQLKVLISPKAAGSPPTSR